MTFLAQLLLPKLKAASNLKSLKVMLLQQKQIPTAIPGLLGKASDSDSAKHKARGNESWWLEPKT